MSIAPKYFGAVASKWILHQNGPDQRRAESLGNTSRGGEMGGRYGFYEFPVSEEFLPGCFLAGGRVYGIVVHSN